MNKQKSIMLAMAGAALVAASQAQAQVTPYVPGDLLLDYRDTVSATPPDLTFDVGNVSTFLASVPAGSTIPLTPAALVLSTAGSFNAADPIGFSAAAEVGSSTLFLTRVISGPNPTGAGLTSSAKQSSSAQSATAGEIDLIGSGYTSGAQVGPVASAVSSGNPDSIVNQALDGSGSFSYKGSQTITSGAGGPIEGSVVLGTGALYEALWEVPPSVSRSNPGSPDVYEGYFTIDPNGNTFFTAAGVSAVPEPSTYGAIAALGLLGLAARRQFRFLTA